VCTNYEYGIPSPRHKYKSLISYEIIWILMGKNILAYAMIAIVAATLGGIALITNGGSLTSTYAQTNQTGAQYCAENDYRCHENYAAQDYDAKNYTGAIYHLEKASESAPPPDLGMHYEQGASSLKAENYTDYDQHYKQVQEYEPPTPTPTPYAAPTPTPPPPPSGQ
jgi:hypothetical protein